MIDAPEKKKSVALIRIQFFMGGGFFAIKDSLHIKYEPNFYKLNQYCIHKKFQTYTSESTL